jgi:serine phosphatase RsbU (regulator of sigma subunit)
MAGRLVEWIGQKKRLRYALLALFILCVLPFAALAYGQVAPTLPPPSDDARTLSGMWEYRLGDSPHRQGRTPDWITDTKLPWQRVGSPGNVDLRSGQVAWFRATIPTGNWEAPSLLVVSSRLLFEVYLGSRYIFSNAVGDQGVRGVAGNNWEVVPLPGAVGGQTLYFRVRAVGMGSEFSNVNIGARVRHLSTVMGASLPRFAIATMLVVLGLIALGVGFIRGASRAIVPLGVTALLSAIYIVTGAPVRLQLIRSGAMWDFFEVGALLFVPVGFYAFLARSTADRAQTYFRRAWQAHLGLGLICLILGGTGLMPMRYVLPIFDVAIILNAVGTGYFLTLMSMGRLPSSRFVVLGSAVLLFGMLGDIFLGSLPELYLLAVPQIGHVALMVCVLVFSYSLLIEALSKTEQIGLEKQKFELAYGAVLDMTGSHSILRSASSAAEVLVRVMRVDRVCTVRLFVKNEVIADDDSAFQSATMVSQGRLVENPALTPIKQKHEAQADSMLSRNRVFVANGSLLVVPVMVNEKKWGFLTFDHYEGTEPFSGDLEYIQLVGRGLTQSVQGVRYIEETWKRAQEVSERELTESLQKLLLPRVIELPNAQAVSNYSAAESTGGDWFGYYLHEKTKCVDFFIGDVTGHGVQSALLAGVASGAVYSHEFTMSQDKFLCELVASERILRLARAVNRAVFEAGHEKLFMSMLFVSINLETGEGWYMNCGHHGFYWIQNQANKTTGMVPTPGNALGYSLTQQLNVEKFKLEQGDLLFLYSAGLTGNEGPEQKKLGVRKLKMLLEKSRDPVELQSFVIDAAKQVWQNEPVSDDVTTVVFKWLGTGRLSENTMAQTIFTESSTPQGESA